MSAENTRQKFDEKAEFMHINEHFESNFNAVLSSAIVFQNLFISTSRPDCENTDYTDTPALKAF